MLRRLLAPHRLNLVPALLAAAIAGCLDSPALPEPADLEPFVGDWRAVALQVVEVDPPNRSEELVEAGATFTLNIQPTGTYTAILTTDFGASVEIGRFELDGTRLRILRDYPSQDVSEGTLELLMPDRVRLAGRTQYSFGRGEPAVEAELEAVLERR